MRLLQRLLFLSGVGLLPFCAFAQDNYVARFDGFAGFVYFESPQINLAERGYHLQFAYNYKPWLAMGFDYSNANGTLNLVPSYLPTALKNTTETTLNLLINDGILPKGYVASVPTHTLTQTFAAGPSLVIRRIPHMAILLHPSLGALREVATPHAGSNQLVQAIVSEFFTGTQELDWTGFFGVGGGLDFGITKHVGLRMHTDVVWDHVLSDFLGNGHWTIRCSIGPSFHFGKNINQ